MSDKENKQPKSGSKYGKRERTQIKKGEKHAAEMKRKKRNSHTKKILTCKTCEREISKDTDQVQHCTSCSEPLHDVLCTVKLNNKDDYCSKCVGQLKWNEIDEFEASNCIKHLILNVPRSAVVKWRSPGQIEQNRLAALARRQQRIIEKQKDMKLSSNAGSTASPEKQLLEETVVQLENKIDSQLKQLKELQLSQTKRKGINNNFSEAVELPEQENTQMITNKTDGVVI